LAGFITEKNEEKNIESFVPVFQFVTMSILCCSIFWHALPLPDGTLSDLSLSQLVH